MIFKFGKKRRAAEQRDKVESRFQAVIDLIRDLDKKEFNRLKEGMDLAWQAYQKVSQTQTTLEKENADIDSADKFLEMEQ